MNENDEPAKEREKNELSLNAPLRYKDLTEPERKMVEMRFLGRTYAEIAQELDYSESHIKKLFMQNGRLISAFMEYKTLQRVKNEETVEQALAKAKAEATDALERVIAISRNSQAKDVFKANEFLLQIAGVTESVALRNYFIKKTFEESQRIVNDLFQSIYGRSLNVVVQMSQITKSAGQPLEFNIGSPDPQQLTVPEEEKAAE